MRNYNKDIKKRGKNEDHIEKITTEHSRVQTFTPKTICFVSIVLKSN